MKIETIRNKNVSVRIPPSKAHTLRSLILASLSGGVSHIRNPLLGEDQLHLIESLKRLGVSITRDDQTITVEGSGGRFHPVETTLDCGESGVAMNFLTALACLSDRDVTLTGKPGLLKRPVGEIVSGVRQLGGAVEYAETEGYPPLLARVSGLSGGEAAMNGEKTSQYFSSLAIASPCAASDVTIVCRDDMAEKPYFDITLDMMRRFGVKAVNRDYKRIEIKAGQRYTACDIDVESDYSSASYFFAAAAIAGATVRMEGLAADSVQGDREILAYAEAMGCAVVRDGAFLTVSGGELTAIDASFRDTPDLVPTVAVMAAFARGTSRLRDVAHLQFKECDRIAAVRDGLGRLGVETSVDGNDLIVTGNPGGIRGAAVSSWDDHRIAMSFSCAGLAVEGISIDNPDCVKKSFPDFWQRFSVFHA